MRIKLFLSILLLPFSFCALAQQGELLLEVKGLPVRDGKIFKLKPYSSACCMVYKDGVSILSSTDSVFSNVNGTVSFADTLVGDFVTIIRFDKNMLIAFSNLKSISFKKDDVIKKSDFIGLIKSDEDKKLVLNVTIADVNGNFLDETSTIAFLKNPNTMLLFVMAIAMKKSFASY